MAEQTYDTIIIGMGMAGLSAAVFTARANIRTLVIGNPKESQLAYAQVVGNYLGADAKSGMEILEMGKEQVEKYGAKTLLMEVVHLRKSDDNTFLVKTSNMDEFRAKTLIIATGVVFRQAGIKGEKEFLGKGVHTCVACDGIFYKGKKVFVVGNGNLAAEESLQLLAFTKNLTILSNGKEFEIAENLKERLSKEGVKTTKDKIAEIKGNKFVKSVLMKNGQELPVDGIFMAMGTATALFFAQSLAITTDKNGFIVIDGEGKTDVKGVYAAGGCTGGYEQIAKSAGEGCKAGISVIRELKGLTRYADQT
ncbi:FAD-dependent oxidoreductase [Candidatus Woesearchaeota archaeon]|nr:FAD-dependent oxidoreductase [Candidatus Woesearchaeota archaeon]